MRRAWVVPLLAVALLCAASVQAGKRDLKIEGKMPADYVAAQAGRAWAVVIGIDEYEKAPRLKYAVADAKAMAGLLQQQGFQVTGLYDKQATRNAIVGELGDKLSARVGEQDRVVIFYAGHGETKKARGGKEMGFLIPVNGQQEALAETGISMGLIRELSDALPSKQVLFLVDVCYGGIAGQQFRRMPPMTEDYLRIITRERGRQLITAGGADQQAMEAPEWGHSVFTYYLLEGLGKGFADLNNDGIIPASELYSYLDSRVFGAAKLKGHTQRPELWALAAEKGEFVFLPGKESKGSQAAPSAALTQAEQELKALEVQERQAEEQNKLVAVQQEIEKKKAAIQEARVRPPSAPSQMGRELTSRDGAPMVLVPAGEFLYGDNNADKTAPDLTTQQGGTIVQALLKGYQPGTSDFYRSLGLAPEQNQLTHPRDMTPWQLFYKSIIGLSGDEMALHNRQVQADQMAQTLMPQIAEYMLKQANQRANAINPQRMTLPAFYMEKFEVTTKLYAQFLQATSRNQPDYWNQVSLTSVGDRPVVGVDWNDADAYCRHYGKRLPTEQEWEKAARGTDGRNYPWGNEEPSSRYANYGRDYSSNFYNDRLMPVGNYEAGASSYGIYDLAGNVWEWTSSDYDSSNKVLRGGSWDNLANYMRSTNRNRHTPTYRFTNVGFRCVQDAR